MAIIDDVINYLKGKITFYNAKKEINVTMRIDETLGILKGALDVATDAQGDQKFDLITTDVGANLSATFTVGETAVLAGNDVLDYGDELTITITPDEGYQIETFKVNGKNKTSPATITVNADVVVVATASAIPEPEPEPTE